MSASPDMTTKDQEARLPALVLSSWYRTQEHQAMPQVHCGYKTIRDRSSHSQQNKQLTWDWGTRREQEGKWKTIAKYRLPHCHRGQATAMVKEHRHLMPHGRWYKHQYKTKETCICTHTRGWWTKGQLTELTCWHTQAIMGLTNSKSPWNTPWGIRYSIPSGIGYSGPPQAGPSTWANGGQHPPVREKDTGWGEEAALS